MKIERIEVHGEARRRFFLGGEGTFSHGKKNGDAILPRLRPESGAAAGE